MESWRTRYNHTLQGRIFPTSQPYCRASFRIEIYISTEYPFEVPKVIFLDRIYHINVSETGNYCCNWNMGDSEWRPTYSIADMITKVLDSIDNPDLNCHINTECLEEYQTDYSKFYRKALDMTLAHGRPRR